MEYEGSDAEVYVKPGKEQRLSKIMEGLVEEAKRMLEGKLELEIRDEVGSSEAGMRFV